MSVSAWAQDQSAPPRLTDVNQWADSLLGTLTLEDKVGEMTQLAIDVLSVGEPYQLAEPHQLDSAKLRKVLVDLRVGSILNVGGHAYSRSHWESIITTIQRIATTEKPSRIPVLYGIDAIHGTNYTLESTLFPQQLGQAATWNLDMARTCGQVTAYETRASGIPWTFSPVLDIGRDPRWPRLWETYGEDVHLASEMGVAYIQGLQGNDLSGMNRIASCMKHFLGYSITLRGTDRSPAWLPERPMREYVMPPFQAAIDAGARTVMICSGETNGIPVHADKTILTDLLRGEMGFTGVAVTDWEDIGYLVTRHKVARTFKEAIAMSINAGIDLAMVPMDLQFPVLLKELVEEGVVPMSRINESVRRILILKKELGLFERPYFPFDAYPAFSGTAHQQAALEAARESVILAKNEGDLLPLRPDTKLLVAGPTSHYLNALNGGWTGTWQGLDETYNSSNMMTIAEALQKQFGARQVDWFDGQPGADDWDGKAFDSRMSAADAVVLCLGEKPYTEKPGDLQDMDLPDDQEWLVREAAKAGKPIILVLIEGRPRIVRRVEPLAQAILVGFLPGNHGSQAIAEILAGQVNPSGRFPITYPRYANDLVTYDHKGTDEIDATFGTAGFHPQWEFGTGLSFSRFAYSNLTLNKTHMPGFEAGVDVTVTVTNTSASKGKEVVQLFVKDHVASITPSVKRLRKFKKIELAPNESQTLTFHLGQRDFSFVGPDHQWISEPGDFTILVGPLKSIFTVGPLPVDGSR
ncbi:MAG: glycoside hydrolase family 3 N-terminal domain-containing protein [Saprospiraceae bacterium]